MDAVLARRETEEGTESNDLLLQQAETEKRQTDGRNAEESEGRREQAHGPSVLAERLSPISRTPPAEAKWGRTSAPFSYRTKPEAGQRPQTEQRRARSRGAAKYFTTVALRDRNARRHRDVRGPRADRAGLGVRQRHAEDRRLRPGCAIRRNAGRDPRPLESESEDRPALARRRRPDRDARAGRPRGSGGTAKRRCASASAPAPRRGPPVVRRGRAIPSRRPRAPDSHRAASREPHRARDRDPIPCAHRRLLPPHPAPRRPRPDLRSRLRHRGSAKARAPLQVGGGSVPDHVRKREDAPTAAPAKRDRGEDRRRRATRRRRQ